MSVLPYVVTEHSLEKVQKVLLDAAKENGTNYVQITNAEISKRSNLSPATVFKALVNLESMGLIEKIPGSSRRTPNTYVLKALGKFVEAKVENKEVEIIDFKDYLNVKRQNEELKKELEKLKKQLEEVDQNG